MKVLIIGSGGREHALARKVKESPLVKEVFCAPGNGGTAKIATNVAIEANDIAGLKKFALEKVIDLTVVGPENPLVLGIVDEFDAASLKIIGPRKDAARLEGSKIKTREVLDEVTKAIGIKIQPKYWVFSEVGAAGAFTRDLDMYPIVIKADGLAGGKGAMVCHGPKDVNIALRRVESGEFGKAAERFLVEEFLEGEEASYIVAVDKNGNILPLASSQDHKAIYDGDKGPNTGGMGAYSPAPVLTPEVEKRVLERIVKPTIKLMADRGTPFFGFLYVGLMIDRNGNPYVVEFNVRLGDPETQPILARMKTDIVEVLIAADLCALDDVQIDWDPRPAVCVVMAEQGYPGAYETGHVISGIEDAEALGAIVDHAGTVRKGGRLLTAGGRVLGVTALGDSYTGAINKVYGAVEKISWGSEYYRWDIGQKALNR